MVPLSYGAPATEGGRKPGQALSNFRRSAAETAVIFAIMIVVGSTDGHRPLVRAVTVHEDVVEMSEAVRLPQRFNRG